MSLAHERKQLLQQLPSGAAESAAQAATRLTNIRVNVPRLQDNCHVQFQTSDVNAAAICAQTRVETRPEIVLQCNFAQRS